MTDHTTAASSPDRPGVLAEENQRLRAELAAVRRQRGVRARSVAAVVLSVLAAIAVVLATAGYWLRSTAFNTGAVVDILDDPLASDEFAAWLSSTVSDDVITALDVEARLENRLGEVDAYLRSRLVEALSPGPVAVAAVQRLDVPNLADFAAPLGSAVNERIRTRVDGFVRSPEIQQVLPEAVARSHEAAVALVRDDLAALPNVAVVDGEVRLALVPLITSAIRDAVGSELAIGSIDVPVSDVAESRVGSAAVAQLREALDSRLPENFGQITIMTASDLAELQAAAALLDRLVWLLVALAVVVIVAAIAVSPNRRRTVVQLGIGAAFGLLVASIAVGNITELTQRAVAEPQARAAVAVLSEAIFSTLTTTMLWLVAVAIVVALVAHLAGRPAWLSRTAEYVSRLLASTEEPGRLYQFAGRHHDTLVIVGLAAALVALFLFDIRLTSVLLIGGVLALYLWFLYLAKQRTQPGPGDGDTAGVGTARG